MVDKQEVHRGKGIEYCWEGCLTSDTKGHMGVWNEIRMYIHEFDGVMRRRLVVTRM